jgi:tRNA threonylcarbamoyladenosine biosynthesis protein TsaE
MIIEVRSEAETQQIARKLGAILRGGEIIELRGDVGTGKTTFVKGLARGLEIEDDVQSPSFTISRVYDARDNLRLAHYDFYRLTDAGIMKDELSEMMQYPETITIIEWADIVEGVLPGDRLTIRFEWPSETDRTLTLEGNEKLLEQL